MMPKRAWLDLLGVVSFVALVAPRVKAGPFISLGPYTPPLAPSTPFVVPIEITGAVELIMINWQFDLQFDPSDVQINVACDPFWEGAQLGDGYRHLHQRRVARLLQRWLGVPRLHCRHALRLVCARRTRR